MLWQLDGLDVTRVLYRNSTGAEQIIDSASWQPESRELLGRVVGVIPREEITGDPKLGHDLLEVALAWRDGDGNQRVPDGEDSEVDIVFVPYVSDIVVGVRLGESVVLVNPPEGLFDLVQPKRSVRVVIRGLLPPVAESLQQGYVRANM